MILTDKDLIKTYFLTHTSLAEKRIKRLASYLENINSLIDKIRRINSIDLDRDWSLYDYEYKSDKTIFSENLKTINEKEIFHGTYTHLCKGDKKYLIQIIGKYGYCKRCDTQFFPEKWWNHPLRDYLEYNEIKYGLNIKKVEIEIDSDLKEKLKTLNVNDNILNTTLNIIHSKYEIEKFLNIKYFDWQNPPPLSKIHSKLIKLYEIWTTRPVKKLGIHPDSNYFFHKCKNKIERILFVEKNLYSWCPSCFAKFIPFNDLGTIEKYKDFFTTECYASKVYEYYDNSSNSIQINYKSFLNSEEFFYLSILGLNERVPIEFIINTFRKLSKIYHPDFGGNSEMFQKIVKAKEWLVSFYKNFNEK